MIDTGTKVFVYRNLRKNLYSVKGPKGRVIDYVDYLLLKNVKYCVGKKGRERVLREKQKNVHAGLRGIVIHYLKFIPYNNANCSASKVSYNPYENETFIREDGSPIERSDFAILTYVNGKPVIQSIDLGE